jgi:hypothetical protein
MNVKTGDSVTIVRCARRASVSRGARLEEFVRVL